MLIDTPPHCRSFLGTTLVVLLLVLVGSGSVAAQEIDPSSPLGAKTVFPRIGIEAGFDRTTQDGTYAVGCGLFDEGAGTNIIMGISYEVPVADLFRIEGLLGFRTRNVNHRYRTIEQSVVQTADGFLETNIDYDNVGSLNSSYLFLQPSFTFYPTRNFYIGLGANFSYGIGSSAQYQRDILTKTATLDDGSVIEIFFPATDSDDPHSRVFPEEEPEQAASILIDPVVMAGLELRLGRDFFIGPRFTYAIPLTPAITSPELTLSSISATIAVRKHLR